MCLPGVRELFVTNRTDAISFDDLPVHQFPHLCGRSEFSVPLGVMRIFDMLHAESCQ